MKAHVFFITAIILLCGALAYTDNSRIHYNNQDLFLNGLNLAWGEYPSGGASFADDIGPTASTPNISHFEDVFTQLEANGANVMRLWLHTNGAKTPAWSGSTVTGPGTNTIADLETILDLAWEHNISMMLCLWSFDMLRISFGSTITDRSMDILTDPTYRQSYIDNCLIPMVTALQGHPAILAWEIFNEPEGMSNEHGWSDIYHVPMSDIQAFVNVCAGAIHRTDPAVLVTNGCWDMQAGTDVDGHYNYYTDARLITAGGDTDGTLDFYCIHYYDWAGTDHSPFLHSASYWGLDKPLVIAEFYPNCTYCTSTSYESLYQNGYAGAMAWSWTDTTHQDMLDHILAVSTAHPADVLIMPEGSPTCSITWPFNNIRIHENTDLTIEADAADTDGTIAKVEFYEGANKLGEDTTSPYSYTWTDIAQGTYTLSAKATDDDNLTTSSLGVTLVVGDSTASQSTRYEAENAVYSGDITIKNDSQASDSRYLDMRNGGTITWTVENIPAAGIYNMIIGHKLAYGSPKTQYLTVNSQPQSQVTFSGSTSAWLEKTVQVSLNAGNNTIRIDGYWSWMYFDYIELPQSIPCSEGDLNLDCNVDFDDLVILAAGWLNPYVLEDVACVSTDWLD